MASALTLCAKKQLIQPPKWLVSNLQYEVIMGSRAYGVSEDDSDQDIYGFAIPPKDIVFPHTAGYIAGFDQLPAFDQYQQHHVVCDEIEYDFSIYNIIKYFKLCIENNPNMVDSLFVPDFCVKHITQVGQLVRDNRKLFLSKLCWPKFRGYAISQFMKIKNKNPVGKRADLVEKFGYDTKFAYHLIRLLDEAEQVLMYEDLSLDKNNEELKAIRRGEWTFDRLEKEFEARKLSVEEIYAKSTLRNTPDHDRIKQLLINCLEIHYGSLTKVITNVDIHSQAIAEITKIIDKLR